MDKIKSWILSFQRSHVNFVGITNCLALCVSCILIVKDICNRCNLLMSIQDLKSTHHMSNLYKIVGNFVHFAIHRKRWLVKLPDCFLRLWIAVGKSTNMIQYCSNAPPILITFDSDQNHFWSFSQTIFHSLSFLLLSQRLNDSIYSSMQQLSWHTLV